MVPTAYRTVRIPPQLRVPGSRISWSVLFNLFSISTPLRISRFVRLCAQKIFFFFSVFVAFYSTSYCTSCTHSLAAFRHGPAPGRQASAAAPSRGDNPRHRLSHFPFLRLLLLPRHFCCSIDLRQHGPLGCVCKGKRAVRNGPWSCHSLGLTLLFSSKSSSSSSLSLEISLPPSHSPCLSLARFLVSNIINYAVHVLMSAEDRWLLGEGLRD